MEKVKASMYSKEFRKKVSINGTEEQAEVSIVSDRLEKSYKNRVDPRNILIVEEILVNIKVQI